MQASSSNPSQDASHLWIASVVALVLSLFITPMFSCMCGHLDRIALSVTLLATGLAWYPFVADRGSRGSTRIVEMVAVVVATMILLKNAADILWFGHSPVFGGG